MNKRIKKKKNKILQEKFLRMYPFLKNNNNITFIKIPVGWKKCFFNIFLEILREELIKQNLIDIYKILEIIEKDGELIINGNIQNNLEIEKIFAKFKYISKHTCFECGELDVYEVCIDNKKIPLCMNCYNKKKLEIPYPIYDTKTHMLIKLHLFFDYNYVENGKEKFQILHIKDILNKLNYI